VVVRSHITETDSQPPAVDPEKKQQRVGMRQIIILFLSLYLLGTLFVYTVFKLPARIEHLLESIDSAICLLFIVNFFYELFHAESKLQYLKWGWIDIISSIPTYPIFWWGRFVRVIRILRILRGVRSIKGIVDIVFQSRAKGTVASALIICFAVAVFASIAILSIESSEPEANIKTPQDAIWWAFSTISTAGYGDRYPVTNEGRFLAILLMTAGVGLFGTATAYVATFFLEPEQKEEDKREERILVEVKAIREKLDSIEKKLNGKG
jgi:voltage-gated potassium channel